VIDIDALARPIAEAAPAGPNLEYADVADLERLATGSPGTIDPKTGERVGAEDPDWRTVSETAQRLLGRTKDLRVAAWLARAELASRGLPGLAAGLALIATLTQDFWATLHPTPEPDDEGDPMERLNVLANLSPEPAQPHGSPAAQGLLRSLRRATIADAREVGRFTVRDLDCALGRLQPPTGQAAPTAALLAAAWRRADPAGKHEMRAAVAGALAALRAIATVFEQRGGQRPALDPLQQALRRVGDFYARVDAEDAATNAIAGGDADAAAVAASVTKTAKYPRSGALDSRADAVRILRQVAEFLRESEPSSPAPMFVDRAVKLLQMDFEAIVMELMPNARERIEMLGGMSLGNPDAE